MSERPSLLLLVLLLMLCLVAQAGSATAPRAFEIADLYRCARVSDVVVGPRGQLAAFTVTRTELATATSWSEIWLVRDLAGAKPELRQLTTGRHHDGAPVFSPDGKRLLFVSDRGETDGQLFVIPVDGGEAQQLSSFPLALASPVWSPDGRHIAAVAEVYPECGADAECNSTISTAREKGPLKAHLSDELLYRHWTAWRNGRFAHILLLDAGSGAVLRDLTPGRWDSPSFSLGGHPGFAFSPDGKELCFLSNHDAMPAASTNADLWLISIDNDRVAAAPRLITGANKGWDGDPVYSPDGRFIAFRSQQTPGYESDLFRLALYDRGTGKVSYPIPRKLLDNWIDAMAWSTDGTALYLQIVERGRTPVYRFALEPGTLQRVVEDGDIDSWQVSPDDRTMLYTSSRIDRPSELARILMKQGTPEYVSSFNDEVRAEVDLRPAQELWVDGAGDYKVQVFVVTPHGFDASKRYPLILNVRGGPQGIWADRFRGDWQVYPGKGYVVAFANPTGSTGVGQNFVDAIACDWGGRIYQDLMKITDALEQLPYVDKERMGAMGWSYGGYMMMWLEGHSTRFKTLASMMGVYDLRSMYGSTEELWFPEHDMCGTPWQSEEYQRWSPSAFVEQFATPCLVISGERDYRVPYSQSLMFFTDLQRRKIPSRLVIFEKAGHWPSWYEMAFYYLVHLDWFSRWLGGEPGQWEVQAFLRNQVFEAEPAQ